MFRMRQCRCGSSCCRGGKVGNERIVTLRLLQPSQVTVLVHYSGRGNPKTVVYVMPTSYIKHNTNKLMEPEDFLCHGKGHMYSRSERRLTKHICTVRKLTGIYVQRNETPGDQGRNYRRPYPHGIRRRGLCRGRVSPYFVLSFFQTSFLCDFFGAHYILLEQTRA